MRVSNKILSAVLLAGALCFSASSVQAAPNETTNLPANGVQSVTKDARTNGWTVVTSSPAWEIKIMAPYNEVLCGTNYAIPCNSTETFTSDGECVYLQIDGVEGHNSSDPYVCATPPVTTPPIITTPTPEPTEPPITIIPEGPPVFDCAEGTVPGWLDEDGFPTTCVNDTPETPATPPVVPVTTEPEAETPAPSPSVAPPAPVTVAPVPVTDTVTVTPENPRELAATGPAAHSMLLAIAGVLVGLGIVLIVCAVVTRWFERKENR